MKKFISTIQNLSERAAQLQAAAQSAPPKIAQLREAVALTTGQLKQLKSDVEIGLTDLKTDSETHLLDSLVEINASVGVFHQAGYDLGGVDLELSPIHQLIVHLNRMEDVPANRLHSLLANNQQRTVTRALLQALIQAEEMAEQVDLTNLVYYQLVAKVGPIPSVRLCWRTEDESILREHAPAQPAAAAVAPAKPATSFTAYGKSSFFAPHDQEQPAVRMPEVAAPTPILASAPAAEATEHAVTEAPGIAAARAEHKPYRSGGKDWGASSLDRFKQMPSTSKYRR
jgi:hypothetical protein